MYCFSFLLRTCHNWSSVIMSIFCYCEGHADSQLDPLCQGRTVALAVLQVANSQVLTQLQGVTCTRFIPCPAQLTSGDCQRPGHFSPIGRVLVGCSWLSAPAWPCLPSCLPQLLSKGTSKHILHTRFPFTVCPSESMSFVSLPVTSTFLNVGLCAHV